MASFANVTKNNNKNSTISFNKKQPIVKSEAVKIGKPQLIITVEIGDGRVGEIHYYDQDEYKDLATRFCKRYNLPPAVIDALTQHIYKNVKALKEKKKQQEMFNDLEEEVKTNFEENTRAKSAFKSQQKHKSKSSNTTSSKNRNGNSSDRSGGTRSDGDDNTSGRKKNIRKKKKIKKRRVGKKKTIKKKKKTKGDAKDVYMRLYESGKDTQSRLDKSAQEAKILREKLGVDYTFQPNIDPNPSGWENGEEEMKDYFNKMGLSEKGVKGKSSRNKHKDIHDRLYTEGLHEARAKLQQAKKDLNKFNEEKPKTWSCPRCCFINSYDDAYCLNLVKNGRKRVPINKRGTEVWQDNGGYSDRKNFSKYGGRSGGPVDARCKAVQKLTWQCCGYERPDVMFKPKIGKMSKNMVRTDIGFQYNVHRQQQGEIEDKSSVFKSLYNPKALSRKVIDLAHLQEQKEMKECTFKPNISKKSVEIVENRVGRRNYSGYLATSSKHEELYNDASKRRIRRDRDVKRQISQYTFKPNIGVNKKRYASSNNNNAGEKGRNSKNSNPDDGDFYERLEKADKAREEHLRQLQEDIAKYDERTGQKLFKPKVGRAPHFARNAQGLPIHEFLFASRHEYEDKKRLMKLEKELHVGAMRNRQYMSKGSTKLIDSMKQKRFMNIFACLLESTKINDSNGKTNDNNTTVLDTSLASTELLDDLAQEILEPVLAQLDGVQLTFDDFSSIMEQLLEDHENGPIHAILTTRKSKEDILADEYRRVQMEETFQPKINPVSKELAASRTSKEPIYEVLSKEGKKHRLNIEAERERLINKELSECTFQPKLISKQIDENGRVYR